MGGIEVTIEITIPKRMVEIKPAYFVVNARPGEKLTDTHSCSAEQGNPVKNRNTAAWPLCCKQEAPFLSAKAGHWEKS